MKDMKRITRHPRDQGVSTYLNQRNSGLNGIEAFIEMELIGHERMHEWLTAAAESQDQHDKGGRGIGNEADRCTGLGRPRKLLIGMHTNTAGCPRPAGWWASPWSEDRLNRKASGITAEAKKAI